MKEIRYNDRLWFGKHKGRRICEIIKGDPAYVQKLVNEYKIKLDEKSNNLFEEKTGRRRMGIEPPIGIGNDPNPRRKIVQCNTNGEQARMVIRHLVNDLFNNTGVSNEVLNAIYESFIRKYRNLEIPANTQIIIRMERLQENRLTERDIIMVIHDAINGSIIGSFDIS